MEKIPFSYSIHPGEILKTEFMKPFGLSSCRLVEDLHVSAPRVNDIVLGKRGITADTAMRLGAYIGCSAQLWLGLQMDHALWVAAKNKSLAEVKPKEKAA